MEDFRETLVDIPAICFSREKYNLSFKNGVYLGQSR